MKPTIIYKKGGKHRGPGGKGYSYKGVSTEEELKTLLSDGWYDNLNDAMALAPKKEKQTDVPQEEEVTIKSIQYKDLTEEDKETILKRLDDGEKPSIIGKDYGLHHLSVVRVKRELD